MHKVLYPNFLQEKIPLTDPKGYLKCLRKNIILISNKILRIQMELRDTNTIQIKKKLTEHVHLAANK